MREYMIPSRMRGSGVIEVRTADSIPAGMVYSGLGMKMIASRDATHEVAGDMIRMGVRRDQALRIARRATARTLEAASARAAEGMGDAGDADPAGQSWLDRTTQIISEYNDPNYNKALVHQEAQIAAQGISALLQARFDDLSPQMVGWLQSAVDTNAKIQADTLSASFQSPWAAGATAFGQQLKSEVVAGATALQKAGQNVVDAATTNWMPWIGGSVALGIAAKLAGIL